MASLNGKEAGKPLFDAHDHKWLFIFPGLLGIAIELVWIVKDGRRARLVEHLYALLGATTFALGVFGLVFSIIGFSDSIALVGIGLSLFGVVDSLSIAKRDAKKNDDKLEQRFARLETLMERSVRINVSARVIDGLAQLLRR